MGLGTTKKKLVVGTAVQRMIPDTDIILSKDVAILKYILSSGGNTSVSPKNKTLSEYIIESAQSSLPTRFKQAYRFAENGRYAYGLPTASSVSVQGVDLNQAVKDVLEADLGHSVSMVYTYLGDANYHHFMWYKLIEDYGYNPTTNELTNLSSSVGFDCYLQSAKLVFGYATVNSDETGETLKQRGFSSESGECLTRSQDLLRASVPIDVNTDVSDAYVEVTYQYIEIVPDTTPPSNPVVNNLSTTTLNGYAEKNSSVDVYVNTVLTTTLSADADGYFNYSFTPNLVTGDVVKLVVKDSALNSSTGVDTTVPYTNPSPVSTGTTPTVTEITHTDSFSFDFLDYINSAVPVVPAEPDDTPTVVVGDDTIAPEFDYIQACYTYDVLGVTHIEYLTYAYGTGGNPALDAIFDTGSSFGEFYPRLYSRLDGQDLPNTLSTTSVEYKSSKRIAKILGIDWIDWSKTLHDSIEDIADVKQMFITLAAPMNTTDPVIREYLYRYWLRVYDEMTVDITTGELAGLNARQGVVMRIKDNVYTNSISFDAVSLNTISGTIGAVGTYSSEYINVYINYIQANYAAGTGTTEYVENAISIHPAHHKYKYQDTPTTYKEIRVYVARSSHIFSGDSTTALGTDENLLVPLDKTVITYLTNKETEILFNKCLYLFVNMAKIIKVKWYQRSGFKIILQVVAVVIAVVTAGAGAPLSVYLIAIGKAILIGLALQAAIKLLIKLGVNASVIGVLAVVALIYSGKLALTNTTGILNLTALEALQISSIAFDMSAKISAFELKELSKEIEAFNNESQEKQAALKQAKELLNDKPIDVSLELLLGNSRSSVFITLGESPEEFMSKDPINTIELINSYSENYVEIMMQPPRLQQLLNQTRRGDDNEFI